MEDKENTQFLGATFLGNVTFNGPMYDIHDNVNVYINNRKIEPEKTEEGEGNENRDILENLIFNSRKFNNQDKLHQLKKLMDDCFSIDASVLAQRDCKKINPQKMNQFFCLYAALYSLNLLSDDGVKSFVRQLALWFPQWVNAENEEKVTKAIYDEQLGWKLNGVLVPCMEWQAMISKNESTDSKRNRFRRITQEIYASFNQLMKSYY